MRSFTHFLSCLALFCLPTILHGAEAAPMRLATFQSDVTPPAGEPMFSGDPLKTVDQPLLAKGIVLEAGGERYVLCAFDWCELCNGGYDSIRSKIAAAAGTDVSHVALQTIHQHTAPLGDRYALKLLADAGVAAGIHVQPRFCDQIEERLAAAVRQSLDRFEPFDQIGAGQAKVDRVASTRRPRDEAGKIRPRMSSAGKDPLMRALPEGKIDPYLKTITLARDGKPLVRLHYYATHPQTLYGDGRASSDVVGDAREKLQQKENVFQIYFTGCGGDITMGKYNDGSKERRAEITERLLAGMEASIAATKLVAVGPVRWRTYPLLLPPRTDKGFSLDECTARITNPKSTPVERLYAGGVRAAFHQRSSRPIELSSLEIGSMHIVNLPGEPLIDFQFFAQGLKPNEFVAVAGYGDCATGYLCPAQAYLDGGYEPTDANVKPESEELLKKGIAALLGVQ
jgi:hypothetical protein